MLDRSRTDRRVHGLPGSSELMRGFRSMMLKMFCTATLALEMSGKAALALAMPNASRKIEKKTCKRVKNVVLRRGLVLGSLELEPRVLGRYTNGSANLAQKKELPACWRMYKGMRVTSAR